MFVFRESAELLLDETSRVVGTEEEAMEVLDSIFDMPATRETMEAPVSLRDIEDYGGSGSCSHSSHKGREGV